MITAIEIKEIKKMWDSINFIPDPNKDQHFLVEKKYLEVLIKNSNLKKEDCVFEIGPGMGTLTRELIAHVKKVIAVERDSSFKKILQDTTNNNNIELIFDNALTILPKRKDFHKIVANLPYQICESLFHYLCSAKNVKRSVLTVPLSFAQKSQEHPVFSAFLKVQIITEVPSKSFYPRPKTISAIITVIPKEKINDNEFIRQRLYLQRDKKLKNGLRDTLIDLYKKKNKTLTKKEADKKVEMMGIEPKLLEKTSAKLPLPEYWRLTNLILQEASS